ncbi:hypothetical protein EIN_485630 [Entamoeba invadens IP1]|uniref:Uncharacterized protein n=1 Tax=Entamoeba invadens IP1 TaxID=370355 RepID=A0A0A1U4J2_ENTIV|nr:hypothetical protein EIN_485630 [Entamoeba invadens IP1]ELP89171.1 hypothetical protein EIN_485630 [Entamoeba invadens IP1]|eukprot:XP_004255942.1 hypothetical protein EIN_485630 [Entamoeba invadens IP1]
MIIVAILLTLTASLKISFDDSLVSLFDNESDFFSDDDIDSFMTFFENDDFDLLLKDEEWGEKFKESAKAIADKAAAWMEKNGPAVTETISKVTKIAGTVNKVAKVVGGVAKVASFIPGVNVVAAPIATAAFAVEKVSGAVKTVGGIAEKTMNIASKTATGYKEGGGKEAIKRLAKETGKEVVKWGVNKVVSKATDTLTDAGMKVLQGKSLDLSKKNLKSKAAEALKSPFDYKKNIKDFKTKTLGEFTPKTMKKNLNKVWKETRLKSQKKVDLKRLSSTFKNKESVKDFQKSKLGQRFNKKLGEYVKDQAKTGLKNQIKNGLAPVKDGAIKTVNGAIDKLFPDAKKPGKANLTKKNKLGALKIKIPKVGVTLKAKDSSKKGKKPIPVKGPIVPAFAKKKITLKPQKGGAGKSFASPKSKLKIAAPKKATLTKPKNTQKPKTKPIAKKSAPKPKAKIAIKKVAPKPKPKPVVKKIAPKPKPVVKKAAPKPKPVIKRVAPKPAPKRVAPKPVKASIKKRK